MKILFVASECVPFVKTGGLADVVGALPKDIARAGEDIRVILPLYRQIGIDWRKKMEHCLYFYINLGWRRQYVGIEKLTQNGITYYFVDNEYYFGRSYIYGLGGDEGERYAFFCRAVLEALPKIDFMPDVLHCHDWQSGLVPPMLEIQYRHLPLYQSVKTVFTVHNLQYQGVFPIAEIENLVSLGDLAYTSDHLEFYGQCSFMKGGLTYAEKITTVSPSYATEIQTAYYGERLDGLLRQRSGDLVGILNGIDTEEYDPETDPMIYKNYTADTFKDKLENKLALQAEFDLEVNPDVPLIGMVGRLSGQKGLDLVERVIDQIIDTGAQVVVLGMGEDKYVDLFTWAQWKYAGKLAARIEMNHEYAHKIYAASDLFLMPSLFEPCGLSQMISLRYGTVPIVRETGGLRDTVLSYNEFTGEGNGFTFMNYNAHDMLSVIERAVYYYTEERETFDQMAKTSMLGQYGWDQSARKYVELYESLLPAPPKKKPARKKAVPAEVPVEIVAEPVAEPVAEAPKKRASRKKAEPQEVVEAVETAEAPEQASVEAPKKRAPRKKKAEETEGDA